VINLCHFVTVIGHQFVTLTVYISSVYYTVGAMQRVARVCQW